jgi:hypothetical protein
LRVEFGLATGSDPEGGCERELPRRSPSFFLKLLGSMIIIMREIMIRISY